MSRAILLIGAPRALPACSKDSPSPLDVTGRYELETLNREAFLAAVNELLAGDQGTRG